MKILLLSSSDVEGGAARAAYRLHQGLQQQKVTSLMLVNKKITQDASVLTVPQNKFVKTGKIREKLDSLPLKFYRQREPNIFSLQWVPNNLTSLINQITPNVINLHWICHGYLPIEIYKNWSQPLIWTLHDMWAFTGGCHYSGQCDRYLNNCGNCPQLNSHQDRDLSRWVWQRKQKYWQNLNLTLVTPSRWLSECVKQSSLLKNHRVEVIPNGINLSIYQPQNQNLGREKFNLPLDKKLLLFGAMDATSDRRKGFHLLQPALQNLAKTKWQNQLELVIFGSNAPEILPELGFKCHYLGKINEDEKLALVYSLADVFVAPSLEDNLPNTVMESIACGTPCVSFNMGGLPDLIEHEKNGYLAKPYEIDDLAQGIIWVLENETRYQKLRAHARLKAEQEFALELQAHRYLALSEELIIAN